MAVLNFIFGGFDVASSSGKLKAGEKVQSAELVSRQSGKISRTFPIAAMLPMTTASRVEASYSQSAVITQVAPTTPREMLYYANLVRGKYGSLNTLYGSSVSGIAYNQPFGKLNISAGRLASAGPTFTVSTLPKQVQRLTSISTTLTPAIISRQAITIRGDLTRVRADLMTKLVIKSTPILNSNVSFASTKLKIVVKSDPANLVPSAISKQAIVLRPDTTRVRADVITKLKTMNQFVFNSNTTFANFKPRIPLVSDPVRHRVDQLTKQVNKLTSINTPLRIELLPKQTYRLTAIPFDKTPQIITKFRPIVPFVFNSNTLFGKSQAITKIAATPTLLTTNKVISSAKITEAAVNRLITSRVAQYKQPVVDVNTVKRPNFTSTNTRIFGSAITTTGYDESSGRVVISYPYQYYDGSYDRVQITGTRAVTLESQVQQYGTFYNNPVFSASSGGQYNSIPYTNFLLAGTGFTGGTAIPFTLEFWIKYDDFGWGQSVMSEEHFGTDAIHLAVGIGSGPGQFSGPRIWFGFYDYNGYVGPQYTWYYLASTNTIPYSGWAHISLQFTGSQLQIFINGRLDASVARNVWINVPGQASNLLIGRRWDTSFGGDYQGVYFNGTLANIRFVKGRNLRTTAGFTPTANFDAREANTIFAVNSITQTDATGLNTITPTSPAPTRVLSTLPVAQNITQTVDNIVFEGDVPIYSYNETSVVLDAVDLLPVDRLTIAFSKIVSVPQVSYTSTSPNIVAGTASPQKYILKDVPSIFRIVNKLVPSIVVRDTPRIRITDMLSRQAIQVRSEQTYKTPAPQINKLKATVQTLELPVLGKTRSINKLVGDRLTHVSGKAKTITTLTSGFDRFNVLSSVQPYTAFDSTLLRITGRSGYTTNTPQWYVREEDILRVIPSGSNVITFFFGYTNYNVIGSSAINFINLTNASGSAFFSNLTVVSYDSDSITVYTNLTIPVGNYYAQLARTYSLNVYSASVGKITKAVFPIVQPTSVLTTITSLARQIVKMTSAGDNVAAGKILPKRNFLQDTVRITSTGVAKLGIVVRESTQAANSIMPMRQFKTYPTIPVVRQFEIAPIKQSIIVRHLPSNVAAGVLAKRAFTLTALRTPITTDRVAVNPIVRSVPPTRFTMGLTAGVDALKNKFAQIPFAETTAKLTASTVVRGDRTRIAVGKTAPGILVRGDTNRYTPITLPRFKTTANDVSVFKYYTTSATTLDTYEAPIDVSSYTVGAVNTTFNFSNRYDDDTNTKIRLLGYSTQNTVKYLTTASYALTFGGTNFYQISDNPSLNFANAYSWTAECWLRPTGNYSTYNTIFAKRSAVGTAYEGYLRAGSGVISFYNGTNYESTYTLPANVWSHCAWVYNLGVIKIYVNGIEVFSQAVANVDVSSPLVVGAAFTGSYFEYYFGAMANFRMLKGVALYTSAFTPVSSIDPLVPNTVLAVNDSSVRDASTNNLSLGGSLPAVSITTLPASPLSIPDTVDTVVLDTVVPIVSYTSTNVVISNISNLNYTQFSKVKVAFVNTVNTQTQNYTTLSLPLDVDLISKPIVKLTSVRPVDVLGKTNAIVKLQTLSISTQVQAVQFKWRIPGIVDNLKTTAKTQAITKINGDRVNFFNTGNYTRTKDFTLVNPLNERTRLPSYNLTIRRFLTEVSPSVRNINYITKAKIIALETAKTDTFRVAKVNLGNTVKGDVNRFLTGKTVNVNVIRAAYESYTPTSKLVGKIINWKWPAPIEVGRTTNISGQLQRAITIVRADATPVLRVNKAALGVVVRDTTPIRFSTMTKLKSYVSHIAPIPNVQKLPAIIRIAGTASNIRAEQFRTTWNVREAQTILRLDKLVPRIIVRDSRAPINFSTMTKLKSYVSHIAPIPSVQKLQPSIKVVATPFNYSVNRVQSAPWFVREARFNAYTFGKTISIPKVIGDTNRFVAAKTASVQKLLSATNLAGSGKLTINQFVRSPSQLNTTINKVDNTYLQTTVRPQTSPTTPREMLYYSTIAPGRYGKLFAALGSTFTVPTYTPASGKLTSFTGSTFTPFTGVRATQFSFSGLVPSVQKLTAAIKVILPTPVATVNKVDNTYLQSAVITTTAPATPRERLYYANLAIGRYGRAFVPYGTGLATLANNFTLGNTKAGTVVRGGYDSSVNLNRIDDTYQQSSIRTTVAPTNSRERLYYATLTGRYARPFNPFGIFGINDSQISAGALRKQVINLTTDRNAYTPSVVSQKIIVKDTLTSTFINADKIVRANPYIGKLFVGMPVSLSTSVLNNQLYTLRTITSRLDMYPVKVPQTIREVFSNIRMASTSISVSLRDNLYQTPLNSLMIQGTAKFKSSTGVLFETPRFASGGIKNVVRADRTPIFDVDTFNNTKLPLVGNFANLRVDDFNVSVVVKDNTYNTPLNNLLIQGTAKFKSNTGVLFETPRFASGGIKNVVRADSTPLFDVDTIARQVANLRAADDQLSTTARVSIRDIIKSDGYVALSGIVRPKISLINDRTRLDVYTTRITTKIIAVDNDFKTGKTLFLNKLITTDSRQAAEYITRPKFTSFGYIFSAPQSANINKNITAFKEVRDYRGLAGLVWPGFKARGIVNSFEKITQISKYKGSNYSPVGFETPTVNTLSRQLVQIKADPNRFLVAKSVVLSKLVQDQEIQTKILGKIFKAQGSGVAGDSVNIPTAGRVRAVALFVATDGDRLLLKTKGELERMRLKAKEISDPTVRRTVPIQFWN
jgi:hypothetical protein